MTKRELKVLIVMLLIFTVIGGGFWIKRTYDKKNEKEYVPNYLTNPNQEDLMPSKVYGVNEYSIINMENSEMASIYLKDFYNMMLRNKEQAYQLLEDDFKTKYYPTIDSFQEFISSVIGNPNSLKIKTKTVTSSQNTYIYDIMTESGINYFFTAEGIMVYRVRFNK